MAKSLSLLIVRWEDQFGSFSSGDWAKRSLLNCDECGFLQKILKLGSYRQFLKRGALHSEEGGSSPYRALLIHAQPPLKAGEKQSEMPKENIKRLIRG